MAAHASSSGSTPPKLAAGAPLTVLRVLSGLTVLNILFQGATAGELLMKNHQARELHETGALVLHVFAALTVIAAALLWRSTKTSPWPTVVAGVVFVGTIVQGAMGHGSTLFIHVPLALVLLLGSAWVLTWATLRPARNVPAW